MLHCCVEKKAEYQTNHGIHIHRVISIFIFTLLAISATSSSVMALGTPPGTNITNQATINYIVEGDSYARSSNIALTRVDEVVDVSVVWQDAANITVNPGDTNQVLTFRLSNTGNGTDTYTLSADSTIGGGQFNPSPVGLYLDTNDNGTYDAGLDPQYVPAMNDPLLPADGSLTVFVLNDIPAGVSDGDLGNCRLTATSNTGTGVPGTVFANAGEGGTDAVAGTSGGSTGDSGAYFVSMTSVSLIKTVQIADPLGGSQPITGAILTYSITITVSGPGTVAGVIATDAVPADTTYRPGTLALNSVILTDTADSDAGDVDASTPGVVTVTLGDLSTASPIQIITFDVTIN
jgi:uncharacterized repeat protein (TIGR01451 family)